MATELHLTRTDDGVPTTMSVDVPPTSVPADENEPEAYLLVQASLGPNVVSLAFDENAGPKSVADGILELLTFHLDLPHLVFSGQVAPANRSSPWPIITAWRVDTSHSSGNALGEPVCREPVGTSASLCSAIHAIGAGRFALALVQGHVAALQRFDFDEVVLRLQVERRACLERLATADRANNETLGQPGDIVHLTFGEAGHEPGIFSDRRVPERDRQEDVRPLPTIHDPARDDSDR